MGTLYHLMTCSPILDGKISSRAITGVIRDSFTEDGQLVMAIGFKLEYPQGSPYK